MKVIYTLLILLIPFIGFGQENSFNILSSEKSNILFDSMDFMYKTDERFKFQIPKNYNFLKFGEEGVLSVFKKIEQKEEFDVSGNLIKQVVSAFLITDIKYSLQLFENQSQNEELLKLSKMSNNEIDKWVINHSKSKDYGSNLEFKKSQIYESKNKIWMIVEGFSTEKNFYTIAASHFKKNNVIGLVFKSNIKGNKSDIKNVKKLIDNIIFY